MSSNYLQQLFKTLSSEQGVKALFESKVLEIDLDDDSIRILIKNELPYPKVSHEIQLEPGDETPIAIIFSERQKYYFALDTNFKFENKNKVAETAKLVDAFISGIFAINTSLRATAYKYGKKDIILLETEKYSFIGSSNSSPLGSLLRLKLLIPANNKTVVLEKGHFISTNKI